MGKYANHEEFGINAPVNYREDTTSESFLNGMTAIAPPGVGALSLSVHRSSPSSKGIALAMENCR